MNAAVVSVQDGLALAEIGPLCVAVWSGAVTRPLFELQASALAQVVGRHPTQAGFLCIVEPGATPPNDELRRASADMIESHGERLSFVAAVIEGSGFQASLTRSVLTAISLLILRRKTKVSFFANTRTAARWAQDQGASVAARDLIAVVEDLRGRLCRVDGRSK